MNRVRKKEGPIMQVPVRGAIMPCAGALRAERRRERWGRFTRDGVRQRRRVAKATRKRARAARL